MTPGVYRAPMVSRRDDVPPGASVARALREGVCGFGGVLVRPPVDLDDAVRLARDSYDARLARRIERFATLPDGSFAWTRDGDGEFWLGRFAGPWRYDPTASAVAVDLVHVRDCQWLDAPVPYAMVPAAVHATFARGGRNFQRIRDPGVDARTRSAWP